MGLERTDASTLSAIADSRTNIFLCATTPAQHAHSPMARGRCGRLRRALALFFLLLLFPYGQIDAAEGAEEDAAAADAGRIVRIGDDEDAGGETREITEDHQGAATAAIAAPATAGGSGGSQRQTARRARDRSWACGPIAKSDVLALRSKIDAAGSSARTAVFANGWISNSKDPLLRSSTARPQPSWWHSRAIGAWLPDVLFPGARLACQIIGVL